MSSRSAQLRIRSLLLFALLPLALGAGPCNRETVERTVMLTAGPDMEFQIRQAFLTARPGDEIIIPQGTYDIREQLALDVSNVTVTGQGMDATILNYGNQVSGAEGVLVNADAFTIRDLAIEDTRGDGIKVQNADGITFTRVRVEWTNGPATENGAYGLYPVRSRNIIAQQCVIRGASDAGIYVGQSENIVVRSNIVEQNVAGIEIENSKYADVYGNSVTGNTGGVLVFDLPNIPVQGGRQTRVWGNLIYDNDLPNFAPEGNIVGIVPGGTGVIIMANDDVEIFYNYIYDNDSSNILIVSYDLVDENSGDPNYDPYPEQIHIHDNYLADGGQSPQGLAGALPVIFGAGPAPDIAWDGTVNPELEAKGGILPPELAICVHDNNPGTRIGNFDWPPPAIAIFDAPQHDCVRVNLAKPDVAAYPDAPPIELEYTDEEVEALCSASGSDVNWAALVVECPVLSDYRLFQTGDPRVSPNGGIPYDLNTPLFSDYTSKYRVVYVPPTMTVPYDASETLDFPVGSVIAKTFAIQADHRVVEGADDLIETRLLVHRESDWVGIPYIWDESDSEAHLALGGGAEQIEWIDGEGDERSTRYEIPNVSQCRSCHGVENGTAPIGPSIRQLNRPFDYAAAGAGPGVAEQLTHWAGLGVLTGAPAPAAAPQLTDWSNGSATLDDRARAYLEANCAHCHNPEGRANTSALFLEHDRMFGTTTGLCKPPVAAGGGSGGLAYDIVPGAPNDSILFFRMASTDPAVRMPELAHTVVHDEGLGLISDWITNLPGSCE